MVLESRQIYRIQLSDPENLVNQMNRIFEFLSDRLDRMESLREDARMFGNLGVDGNINCEGDINATSGTIESNAVETVTVEVEQDGSIEGDLSVTGNSALTGTLNITGAVTAAGAVTIQGTLTVTSTGNVILDEATLVFRDDTATDLHGWTSP